MVGALVGVGVRMEVVRVEMRVVGKGGKETTTTMTSMTMETRMSSKQSRREETSTRRDVTWHDVT
jgi:hypothetical protein